MPASWHELSPMQRAMLLHVARDGPFAVSTKIEMRTVASLNRRGFLRPGNPRSGGAGVKGRWCLTAAGRGMIAGRDDPAARGPGIGSEIEAPRRAARPPGRHTPG